LARRHVLEAVDFVCLLPKSRIIPDILIMVRDAANLDAEFEVNDKSRCIHEDQEAELLEYLSTYFTDIKVSGTIAFNH
jgi:hypothetical protein